MHVLPEGNRMPGDGLLRRDELWNKSITDSVNKKLVFYKNGIKNFSLPLTTVDDSRICTTEAVTIPARTIQSIPIQTEFGSGEIVVHKKEISPNVYVANTITELINGKAFLTVLNANNKEIKLIPSIELNYSFAEEYSEYVESNINQTKEINRNNRFTQLMDAVNLSENLNEEELESIEMIFKEFADIFHLPGDELTYITVLQHEIETEPGRAPINTRQYRLPEIHKQEINTQVIKC